MNCCLGWMNFCHWLGFETQKSQEKELGYFGPVIFPLKIMGEVTNKILCKHRAVNQMNSHQMDLSREKSCQTNLTPFVRGYDVLWIKEMQQMKYFHFL